MAAQGANLVTVRLGLVGLGWGARIAEAARDLADVRIAACFARSPTQTQAFAEEFGCRAAGSFQALVEDETLDGIVLMTPNSTHCPLAVAALAAGRHVLVTKPIATTLADAAAMIAAARSAGRILAVGHQSRRQFGVRKLKELVEAGDLGPPVLFEGNTSSPTGLTLESDSWRASSEECPGGPLIQLGIHYIDNAQYLMGPIQSVSGCLRLVGSGRTVPGFATLCFGFADGAGTLVSSYVSPHTRWMRVSGEIASAVFDDKRGVTLESPRREPWVVVCPDSPELRLRQSLQDEIAEFAACIRDGRRPEVDGSAGARNLAVVLAAVESHRSGETVLLRDLCAEFPCLVQSP